MGFAKEDAYNKSSWYSLPLFCQTQTSSPTMAGRMVIVLPALFLLLISISSTVSFTSTSTSGTYGLTDKHLLNLLQLLKAENGHVHAHGHGGYGTAESALDVHTTDHVWGGAGVKSKPEQKQQHQGSNQQTQHPEQGTRIDQISRTNENRSVPTHASNKESTPTGTEASPRPNAGRINPADRLTRQLGRVNPFVATQQQREEEGYQDSKPKSKNIDWLEKYSAITVMLGMGEKYIRCTHNLLDQIRNHGEWKGDLIMLEPEDGFPEGLAKWRIYWEKTYGVRYRKMSFVKFANSQNITLRTYTGGTIVWEKMTMLTDSFFRKYAYLWWVDSDSEILGPLRPVIDTFALDNGSFYGNLRFQGDHSLEWDKLSPEVVAELEPKRTYFDLANSFMIWKVRDIEPADKLIAKMVDLLHKAGHAMKYPEQSLLSLMYWDTQQRLTVRYNVEENQTCDDGMKHVIVRNRDDGVERRAQKLARPKWCQFPVFHDTAKKCGTCEMPEVDENGNLVSQADNSQKEWCSQRR